MIAIFIMTLIGATADAAACDEMYQDSKMRVKLVCSDYLLGKNGRLMNKDEARAPAGTMHTLHKYVYTHTVVRCCKLNGACRHCHSGLVQRKIRRCRIAATLSVPKKLGQRFTVCVQMTLYDLLISLVRYFEKSCTYTWVDESSNVYVYLYCFCTYLNYSVPEKS